MLNIGTAAISHSLSSKAIGKRPTGLTVLAIVNFVMAFFAGIVTALLYAAMKLVNTAAHDLGAKGDVPGSGGIYATLALAGVAVIALVIAGIGYLKQAKLGWIAAHVFAVAEVTSTILAMTVAHAHISVLGYVMGFGFPAVTVALVNTVFRKNLAN